MKYTFSNVDAITLSNPDGPISPRLTVQKGDGVGSQTVVITEEEYERVKSMLEA